MRQGGGADYVEEEEQELEEEEEPRDVLVKWTVKPDVSVGGAGRCEGGAGPWAGQWGKVLPLPWGEYTQGWTRRLQEAVKPKKSRNR